MRLPLREFGQGLGLKFMRVIRDGTLRSSSLAARRPRRCNFEGNLTWATGASVSYGQMFTVKIVIVLPKASGSCSHECALSLSLFRETKMSHTHGRLILLFAGSCPVFYCLFMWKVFLTYSLVGTKRFYQYFTAGYVDNHEILNKQLLLWTFFQLKTIMHL